MFYRKKSAMLGASLIALTMIVAGCGGDSGGSVGGDSNSGSANAGNTGSNAGTPVTQNPIDVADASIVTSAAKVSGGVTSRSGNDFSFPAIVNQNGSISMTIPSGRAPLFAARRTVASGSGATVQFGDPVSLKYDMFSWSTGELVESSAEFEEAHIVRGGVTEDQLIPEYLAMSLLGRSLGDTIQVILPVGTTDLPAHLDSSDAYILLVEML